MMRYKLAFDNSLNLSDEEKALAIKRLERYGRIEGELWIPHDSQTDAESRIKREGFIIIESLRGGPEKGEARKAMKIENGTIITVKALEWREDWEFDHPTVILSPVRRYSPNGESISQMVEELGIDACVTGTLIDEDNDIEFEWRGWSWKRLERVFREAMNGKKFPKRGYVAAEYQLRFHPDEYGDLAFTVTPEL